VVEKNCCRGLKFSNYRDAIPLTDADRREQVIDNPTVVKEPAYYEHLYGSLNDILFIGSIKRYLETLDISDFRPGAHATMNTAKELVLLALKTEIDFAVEDFRASCTRELVSRHDIDDFVRDAIRDPSSYSSAGPSLNTNYVTHVIAEVGMVSTGERVKDRGGTQHSIVIVDTQAWSIDRVRETPNPVLLKLIGKDRR
jgi:hypothetical protein